MAQYTVAAAEVKQLTGSPKLGVSGAALTAGQSIYKDGNGKWQPAQADGTTLESGSGGVAIAICSTAAADQAFAYADAGDVQLDTAALAGAATGDIVVLGATAGGLYPSGDLASTNKITIVGVMKTANPGVITLNPWATQLVKP